MEREHYDLSDLEPRADLTDDEDLYRAFGEAMGEDTDLAEEEPRPHLLPHGDGTSWTAWPLGPPSEDAVRMAKTKAAMRRASGRDPAPEMSDDEIYEQAKAMSNWED